MSTLAEEIADDWKDFDGLEVVTLLQVRGDGRKSVPMSYVNANGDTQGAALRRGLNRRDMVALAGAVTLTGDETVFELPASLVGANGVRQRDVITDADDMKFRVIRSDLVTLKTRWRCVCQLQE